MDWLPQRPDVNMAEAVWDHPDGEQKAETAKEDVSVFFKKPEDT